MANQAFWAAVIVFIAVFWSTPGFGYDRYGYCPVTLNNGGRKYGLFIRSNVPEPEPRPTDP
jgi:hypothetical protein